MTEALCQRGGLTSVDDEDLFDAVLIVSRASPNYSGRNLRRCDEVSGEYVLFEHKYESPQIRRMGRDFKNQSKDTSRSIAFYENNLQTVKMLRIFDWY